MDRLLIAPVDRHGAELSPQVRRHCRGGEQVFGAGRRPDHGRQRNLQRDVIGFGSDRGHSQRRDGQHDQNPTG